MAWVDSFGVKRCDAYTRSHEPPRLTAIFSNQTFCVIAHSSIEYIFNPVDKLAPIHIVRRTQ